MLKKEQFELSLYKETSILKSSTLGTVAKVFCTLDHKTYIKRTTTHNNLAVYRTLLQHPIPFTPTIYGCYFNDGIYTYIEEFMYGHSIKEYFTIHNLSNKDINEIFMKLLTIIHKIHMQNIIHRDIKPDNIMINSNLDPILIDFSISCLYDPFDSQDAQNLGTKPYASPEHYGFAKLQTNSDLYSLGITGLELLDLQTSYHGPWTHIFRQCTCKDVSIRYQSASTIFHEYMYLTHRVPLRLFTECNPFSHTIPATYIQALPNIPMEDTFFIGHLSLHIRLSILPSTVLVCITKDGHIKQLFSLFHEEFLKNAYPDSIPFAELIVINHTILIAFAFETCYKNTWSSSSIQNIAMLHISNRISITGKYKTLSTIQIIDHSILFLNDSINTIKLE